MTPETIAARDRLIVGLDLSSPTEAERMVATLGDAVCFYKVGMQLSFSGGLSFARELVEAGKNVFLDMKLLDIPNTVAHAVEAIADMGVTFTTIHAYPQAMRAAVEARGDSALKLLGVTVLTSLDDSDLAETGYASDVGDLVLRRAGQAGEIGMDGLICSPKEVAAIREEIGNGLTLVTPGIRPAGSAAGDQKRAATPESAIRHGADYLVVARPVIQAADPLAAANAIVAEIEAALE
jgi:orotidine-5'-phosphate decarboxylase